ncbi:MAG TPA: hypothetical protein VFH89_14125 [Sphingomicrobium sp.]|nr:hypothetical protein [Sphingomicrobium sp.]
MSAACLEDADQDGKFEEGLRLDFNSERADILVITPSGKVIGARFSKARLRLPRLVGYSPAQDSAQPTGKLALRWKRGPKKGPPIGLLWLSTPDNYTGTDGLSENVLAFDTDKLPMDVELYGLSIRILGFDEKGGLRYSVLGMKDGTAVPLVFRGDVFHIIGY